MTDQPTLRVLDTNRELAPDVPHPTRIRVVPRDTDCSAERTDKRTSVAYLIEGISGQPGVETLVFHEGCNPFGELNGFLVEDLVAICADRMAEHQSGPFACEENYDALCHLHGALNALARRRKRRAAEGTLGTQRTGEAEQAMVRLTTDPEALAEAAEPPAAEAEPTANGPRLTCISVLPQPADDVLRILADLERTVEAGATGIVVIVEDHEGYYQTSWGGDVSWVEAIGMAELARDAITRAMRRGTYGPLDDNDDPAG